MKDIFFIFVGLLFVCIAIATYLAPTIVAVIRQAPNIGAVVVINMLAGWLIVGWLIALAFALRPRPFRYHHDQPTVQMRSGLSGMVQRYK